MEQPKLEIDKWGHKRWRLPNGELHRTNGPAIERDDGDKYWYLNDIWYTEEEFEVKMMKKKLELFG